MGRFFTIGSCSFFNSANLLTLKSKSNIVQEFVREAFPTIEDFYEKKFNIYRYCNIECTLTFALESIMQEGMIDYTTAEKRLSNSIRMACYSGRKRGLCRCFPRQNDFRTAGVRRDCDFQI